MTKKVPASVQELLDHRLYTTSEVAEMFGVSSATIRLWIKKDILHGFKPFGAPSDHWRIKQEEVDRVAGIKYGDDDEPK